MILGIVRKTVTATVKHPVYEGRRLLVVEKCRPDWSPTGSETLAVDLVGAGIGDRVMVLKEGNSARAVFGTAPLPLQEMVVAIVDSVDIGTASHDEAWRTTADSRAAAQKEKRRVSR